MKKNSVAGNGFKWLARALLVVVVAILVAAVSPMIRKVAERSDFFQLTSIKIEGCSHTTNDQILAKSGLDRYPNLVGVDCKAVAASISELDWVEKVAISKGYPSQLTISVVERRPEAMVNLAEGLYFVDAKGVVFSKVAPGDSIDYPVITGLDRYSMSNREKPSGGDGDRMEEQRLQEAVEFIRFASKTNMNAILPRQNISQLHFSETEGAVLFLASNPFPVYLGAGDLREQFRRLEKVLNSIYRKQEIASVAYIRMKYEKDKVLVGMLPKA